MKLKFRSAMLLLLLTQILLACGGSGLFARPTSTPFPTPTNDPLSAARVVQAFWDAMAAKDLETALVYVHEDITCAVFCHFTGKEIFSSYLQGYLDAGYSTQISEIKTVGNIVTYSWAVYRNDLFLRRGEDDEMMEVENGKIIYWENYHR